MVVSCEAHYAYVAYKPDRHFFLAFLTWTTIMFIFRVNEIEFFFEISDRIGVVSVD